MNSKIKISQIPKVTFFNSVDQNRKIGILFFIISIIVHALFFVCLIFFQDFKLPKTMPPVVQIDLVSFAPDPVIEDKNESEIKSSKDIISTKKTPKIKSAKKPVKETVQKIPTIKPDISLKTKPKNLKELIAANKKKKKEKKPVEKIKPKNKVDPKKALKEDREKLEKKVEEQNQDRLAQALKRLQEKVKDQDVDKNSTSGYDKKGYKPIDLYKMVLGATLKQNWVFSDVLAKKINKDLEVRILIKILKSGEIRDIIFETRSGNQYLDDSAKKAIKKSNPLPALPKGMRSYDIVVIFTPQGLK